MYVNRTCLFKPNTGSCRVSHKRTLSKLYLLFITCWRSCWNSVCSNDTTASRPGGRQAPSSTTPRRGGGNLNFFLYGRILWIWPHAVVVIYLLNLQKNPKMSGVFLTTYNQTCQESLCYNILSVFAYGCAVFCFRNVSQWRTWELDADFFPVRLWACHLTVHCASNTNLTHHQTVIVQHLFMEDREINVI